MTQVPPAARDEAGLDIRRAIDEGAMSRFQVLAVALCVTLNMLDGFDVLVMAFTAPEVAKEWSLSGARLGMLLSAVLLGMGVLAREPVWIVIWFTLALGAIGASEGPFWATAVDIGGRSGGTAAAICNTGGNLGGLLAPTLTPWVSDHWGWPSGIALGGVICFLGALCWCRIDPRSFDDDIQLAERPA